LAKNESEPVNFGGKYKRQKNAALRNISELEKEKYYCLFVAGIYR